MSGHCVKWRTGDCLHPRAADGEGDGFRVGVAEGASVVDNQREVSPAAGAGHLPGQHAGLSEQNTSRAQTATDRLLCGSW